MRNKPFNIRIFILLSILSALTAMVALTGCKKSPEMPPLTSQEKLFEAARVCDPLAVAELIKDGQIDLEARRIYSEEFCQIQKAKKSFECVDNDQMTPLMLASFHSCAPVVQLLLQAGANPNATRPSGNTSLIDASMGDQVEIVRLLIQSGANKKYIRPDHHPVSDFTLNSEILHMLK